MDAELYEQMEATRTRLWLAHSRIGSVEDMLRSLHLTFRPDDDRTHDEIAHITSRSRDLRRAAQRGVGAEAQTGSDGPAHFNAV